MICSVYLSVFVLLISFTAAAGPLAVDKSDVLYGVKLISGKSDSTRFYDASISKAFDRPLAQVMDGITNFAERCNDDFKSKRLYTKQEADCAFHHDHLIETFVVREIRKVGWLPESGEVDRYLLGRTLYNRGYSEFYELVKVIEGKNQLGQRVSLIKVEMLDDAEVRRYTEPKFRRDAAFQRTSKVYELTEVAPEKTHLSYRYHAETSHWLLNKELAVPQVFSSLSKGANGLLRNITLKFNQTRQLASRP